MRIRTAYLVGQDLVYDSRRPFTDGSFIEEMNRFLESVSGEFKPLQGHNHLTDSLQAGVSRWEYFCGAFIAHSASSLIFRFWPDWVIAVCSDDSEAVELLWNKLAIFFGKRFLDGHTEFNITISDKPGSRVCSLREMSQRSAFTYFGNSRAPLSNKIDAIFAHHEGDLFDAIRPVMICEYDIRALHSNLQELRSMRSLLDELETSLRESYLFYLNDQRLCEIELTRRIEQLAVDVNKYCNDVFTCAHDIDSYCEILKRQWAGNEHFLSYYSNASAMATRVAVLIRNEVSKMIEKAREISRPY
jgi:hypothetical protein